MRASTFATCLLTVAIAALPAPARMQDAAPLVESADTRYYDFWIGTWKTIKDGAIDPAGTTFTVTRGIHPGALEETWSGAMNARAFRAWDKTRGRWMHV